MKKHKVTKFRKRRSIEVKDIFGGECEICGYNKSYNSLVFHHTDPKLKEYAPTYIINSWSLERTIKQLIREKVILLCANCHGEIHDEEYDFSYDKKVISIIKSKCENCEDEFYHNENKERKYCSQECTKISQRKVKNRPPIKKLNELLKKHSFVKVGKMYGVSDNTIRNWLK